MSAPASTALTSSVRGRLVTGTEVAITARQHEFTIDEPQSLGGADKGANPIEHLLAARASCTVISYQVWADSRRPGSEADYRRLTPVATLATWQPSRIGSSATTAPRCCVGWRRVRA